MTAFYTSPIAMVLIVLVHRRKIITAFQFLRFKIEISSNIKVANFLDVTLNLSDNSYRTFLKTIQYSSYVNVNSIHPCSIIKQVPKLLIWE